MLAADFYLGTNMTRWLGRVSVPLFVSHRRLAREHPKRLPVAQGDWVCDSGAFTEISSFGEFQTTPQSYVAALRRYASEVGSLQWAAPQDHMCEPWVLAKSKVASTVDDAQRWTVDNLLTLRDLDPPVNIIPVLQGLTLGDYRNCAHRYAAAGIDLLREPLVGLGSVCRRQATDQIAELIAALHGDGLRLHGFGVKSLGLRRYGWCLTSADSMAWSLRGRNVHPCPHGHKTCASCLPFALAWRDNLLTEQADRPVQMGLW